MPRIVTISATEAAVRQEAAEETRPRTAPRGPNRWCYGRIRASGSVLRRGEFAALKYAGAIFARGLLRQLGLTPVETSARLIRYGGGERRILDTTSDTGDYAYETTPLEFIFVMRGRGHINTGLPAPACVLDMDPTIRDETGRLRLRGGLSTWAEISPNGTAITALPVAGADPTERPATFTAQYYYGAVSLTGTTRGSRAVVRRLPPRAPGSHPPRPWGRDD